MVISDPISSSSSSSLCLSSMHTGRMGCQGSSSSWGDSSPIMIASYDLIYSLLPLYISPVDKYNRLGASEINVCI